MTTPTPASDLNADTPVVFCDGSLVFNDLKNEDYIAHQTGLFILAPSGTGKTYFVNGQFVNNWIDGDYLWSICGADYTDETWNGNMEEVMEINARCDTITLQAKKAGLWVVGSSNLFLQPDAIVLPNWRTHQRYITARENIRYGDGATTVDLEAVKQHRSWIRRWRKYGVPCFESITEATKYCETLSITKNNIRSSL